MKIVFFPSGCLPFHAHSLDERPLGGMETAVIRLAAALSSGGHDVKVFTSLENPPLSTPLYLPQNAIQDLGPVDILIAVREWRPAFLPIQAKKKMLWTGDSYDQPQNIGIGDKRIAKALDFLLPVSSWHASRLCQESGFPLEKVHVLPNGVHLPYFANTEVRNRKRLIYSSTPYRGLQYLADIFPRIKANVADAELHVFSGYRVYEGSAPYPESVLREFAELAQRLSSIDGCSLHGNVKQAELAREYSRSGILAYPNSFEETSCITAMEAQAAGVVTVSSALGALPETVGDAGILIPGQPHSKEYQDRFVDAVSGLLINERSWSELSQRARARGQNFAWDRIADNFSRFLSAL